MLRSKYFITSVYEKRPVHRLFKFGGFMNFHKNIICLIAIFLLAAHLNAFSASAADQAFQARKYNQALNQYQSLLGQSSSNEDTCNLNFRIAECHFYLGHKKEAISYYRQAYTNTKNPYLKIKAGHRLVQIQTVDGQYEDSFATAREILHQGSNDDLTVKTLAYGTYSAWKLSSKRSLSLAEKADCILMWEKFKNNYSKLTPKFYLKNSSGQK